MMGWSKVSYYLWVIGAILLLPLIVILLVNVLFLGLLFLALLGLIGWLQYRVMHENRYIVFQDEVAVRMVVYKTRCYRIDMIKSINYVDIGTDWFGRTPPNGRYQLAVYFERSYLKSVEPLWFGPVDRDGFVAALLEVNPDIVVDRSETHV